jgi:hypothetical protein
MISLIEHEKGLDARRDCLLSGTCHEERDTGNSNNSKIYPG